MHLQLCGCLRSSFLHYVICTSAAQAGTELAACSRGSITLKRELRLVARALAAKALGWECLPCSTGDVRCAMMLLLLHATLAASQGVWWASVPAKVCLVSRRNCSRPAHALRTVRPAAWSVQAVLLSAASNEKVAAEAGSTEMGRWTEPVP